jgi:hypothetical protein
MVLGVVGFIVVVWISLVVGATTMCRAASRADESAECFAADRARSDDVTSRLRRLGIPAL